MSYELTEPEWFQRDMDESPWPTDITNFESADIDLDRFQGGAAKIRARGEATETAAESGSADDCCSGPGFGSGSGPGFGSGPRYGFGICEAKALVLNLRPSNPLLPSTSVSTSQQTGETVDRQLTISTVSSGETDGGASMAPDGGGSLAAGPVFGRIVAGLGGNVPAGRDGFLEDKTRAFASQVIRTKRGPGQNQGPEKSQNQGQDRRQNQGKSLGDEITYGADVDVPGILASRIFLDAFDGHWLRHHVHLWRSGVLRSEQRAPWPRFVGGLLEKIARVFMDPNPCGGWMLARASGRLFWYPNHFKLAHYFRERAARRFNFPWETAKMEAKTEYRQEWGELITWTEYEMFKSAGSDWQRAWDMIRDMRRNNFRKGS